MRRFVVIVLVCAAAVLFFRFGTAIRAFCSEASYPFRRTAARLGGEFSSRFGAAWRGFCDGPVREAQSDEVERLCVMLGECERALRENDDLRAALDWARRQPVRAVAAPVWAHGGGMGVWPRLTLGVGSAQGVAANDIVVVPEGLVGRVAPGVSRHMCEVVLISDPACRIAAEIPGVTNGVIFGMQGEDAGESPDEPLLYAAAPLDFRFLARGADVRSGQEIRTEGSGGIFPRGLLIGHVAALKPPAPGDLFLEAQVLPVADPALLRTVFVLAKAPAGEASHGER